MIVFRPRSPHRAVARSSSPSLEPLIDVLSERAATRQDEAAVWIHRGTVNPVSRADVGSFTTLGSLGSDGYGQ